jgi:hypothetical protein
VLARTTNDDLLNPGAPQVYGGDIIQGAIQVQEKAAEVLLITKEKNTNLLLSGFGKPLKKIKIPPRQQLSSLANTAASLTIPTKIKSIENSETVHFINYFSGFVEIFHPNKKALQTLLTTKGLVCIEPFPERLEDLKTHTFLSRSKAGIQYLEQVLWVLTPHQVAQEKLLEILQR